MNRMVKNWKLPSIGHCLAGQYVLGWACLLGLFCIRSTYLLVWGLTMGCSAEPKWEFKLYMVHPNKAFSLQNSWGANKKSRTLLYEVGSCIEHPSIILENFFFHLPLLHLCTNSTLFHTLFFFCCCDGNKASTQQSGNRICIILLRSHRKLRSPTNTHKTTKKITKNRR
jgi:hypothetical protein